MNELIELVTKITTEGPIFLEGLCQVLGILSIVATAIVKLTPSPKDDEKVGKVVGKIWDFVSYLPTIGVNPKTKNLEESLKSLNQS